MTAPSQPRRVCAAVWSARRDNAFAALYSPTVERDVRVMRLIKLNP